MTFEADNQRFTRATHRFVLNRPDFHALTNVMVAETAELRLDEVLKVDHLFSEKFR